MGGGALPRNLAFVHVLAENAVQQNPQIGVGGVIAVDVKRPVRFQHPAYFDEADGHIGQVGGVRLRMGAAGGFHHLRHHRVVVLQFFQPGLVNIVLPGEHVRECHVPAVVGPFHARLPGGGPVRHPPRLEQLHLPPRFVRGQLRVHFPRERLVFGERRVDAHQVHGGVVQPLQQFQVVYDEQAPVKRMLAGRSRHALASLRLWAVAGFTGFNVNRGCDKYFTGPDGRLPGRAGGVGAHPVGNLVGWRVGAGCVLLRPRSSEDRAGAF